MSQPAHPERDTAKIIGGILLILAAGIYLLNPTAGVFELVPDNLPIVGNMDEAAAAALILWGFTLLRRGMNIATPEDQAGQRVLDAEPVPAAPVALPDEHRTPE